MIAQEVFEVTCWDCDEPVPDYAQFCPHCGLNQRDRRSRPLYIVDSATGLSNEAFIRGLLEYEQLRAVRHARPLSVLVLRVSPGLEAEGGNPWGLIRDVGEALKAHIRETDSAGFIGTVERPLFAVILPETNQGGATIAAGKLRSLIDAQARPGGELCTLVGTATYEPGCGRPADLLKSAAESLEDAEETGVREEG